MSAELSELFGYAAASLTTVAFVPQAWKSWRTRDLAGVSLPTYTLFTIGVAMWMVYGLATGSMPVIVANAVTILPASLVLWLKVMEARSAPAGAKSDSSPMPSKNG